MLYPICYLQLSQGANVFRTTLFQIQASNDQTTTWGLAATSNAEPSSTNSSSEAVSPTSLNEDSSIHTTITVTGASHSNSLPSSPSSTQAPANFNVAAQRPAVVLDSDHPGAVYTANQVNCIDNGSPYEPGCWEVLQISRWLPKWFIETQPCPIDQPNETQVDCNRKPPGVTPEPWTTTFLREYSRGGDAKCLKIGLEACTYNFNMNDGLADKLLLRARYRYVRYNIISKLSPTSLCRYWLISEAISILFNTWY